MKIVFEPESNELREDTDMTLAAMKRRLQEGKSLIVGSTNEAGVAAKVREASGVLRSYQGSLYEYDATKQHYTAVMDPQVMLRRFVESLYLEQVESVRVLPGFEIYADQIRPRGIKGGWLTDVEASLHASVSVPSDTQVPCWLATAEETHTTDEGEVITLSRSLVDAGRKFIATKNMLIDVDHFVKTGDAEEPDADSSDWFSLHRMPYAYREGAVCPRWLAFLDQMLEGDAERIALLQEWFGYTLMSDTRFHKFLLLEGEGANGKSVIVDVMTGMLGQEAVSSLPLTAFAGRFDKYHTFGKALNICSEASELTPRLEDQLKAYISGDLITSDRKHRELFQFRPTARLVVTTNNRPKVADESIGFWRRMLLIPFQVQVSADQMNPQLSSTLLEREGEGILQWALEGLQRLMHNKQFTEPEISKTAKVQYKKESSPVLQFIEECLKVDEGCAEECMTVYKRYARWAQMQGERPMTDGLFGKSLRLALPQVSVIQHRVAGARQRSYLGLEIDT